MAATFFAHSAGCGGSWEPMVQHLLWVTDLAVKNGESFGAEDECRFAGMLHDLGKYGIRFQGRLHGTESHIDHWSAGAFEAVMAGCTGFAAALAIQGHHIGLQRGDRDSLAGLNITNLLRSHPLGCKLSDDDHQAIKNRAQAEGISWKAPAALHSAHLPNLERVCDFRSRMGSLAAQLEVQADHFFLPWVQRP